MNKEKLGPKIGKTKRRGLDLKGMNKRGMKKKKEGNLTISS